MGPVLNYCSLDRVCHEGQSFQDRIIQLKIFEFVDDIDDAGNGIMKQKGAIISLLQFSSKGS